MDYLEKVRKLNTKPVNTILMSSVFFLLGLNFLLYSFFDFGAIRNLVRAAAGGLMLVILLLRLAENEIRQRQMAMLLLVAWQVLAGGTNGLNIAFLLLLTVAAAGNKKCDVFKITLWVMAVLMAIAAFSLLFGIEQNEVYTVGTRTRHKFGFDNVNSASMFLFTLLCAYLLFRGREINLYELGIAMAIELISFLFTDSRTPLLGLAFMIFVYLLVPRIPERVGLVICRVGIALLFLTAYLWVLPAVNSPLVNKILSLRPMYCDEYFRNQNVWSFLLGGSRVKELDNGYLLLLFNAGVFVYTGVYFLVQAAAENLYRRGDHMKLSFLVTMLACSVLEGTALRPELLCAPVLWIIVMEAQGGEGKESRLLALVYSRLSPGSRRRK